MDDFDYFAPVLGRSAQNRRPLYVVVHTAPGEGVRLFGLYQTSSALSSMLMDVFGADLVLEPIDLRGFPTSMVEGVERGFRIWPDPGLVGGSLLTTTYVVLECYPA